jgi:hypothetical protein
MQALIKRHAQFTRDVYVPESLHGKMAAPNHRPKSRLPHCQIDPPHSLLGFDVQIRILRAILRADFCNIIPFLPPTPAFAVFYFREANSAKGSFQPTGALRELVFLLICTRVSSSSYRLLWP